MPSLSPWQVSTSMTVFVEHDSDSGRGHRVRPIREWVGNARHWMSAWRLCEAQSLGWWHWPCQPHPSTYEQGQPSSAEHLEQPLTSQERPGSSTSLLLSLGPWVTYLPFLCFNFLIYKIGIIPTSFLGGLNEITHLKRFEEYLAHSKSLVKFTY